MLLCLIWTGGHIGSERLKSVNRTRFVEINVDGRNTIIDLKSSTHPLLYYHFTRSHSYQTLRRLDFLVKVSVPCEPGVEVDHMDRRSKGKGRAVMRSRTLLLADMHKYSQIRGRGQ